MTISSINACPDETFLYTFSFLNPIELSYAQAVCRRWKRIGDDSKLWTRFSVLFDTTSKFHDYSPLPWQEALQKHGFNYANQAYTKHRFIFEYNLKCGLGKDDLVPRVTFVQKDRQLVSLPGLVVLSTRADLVLSLSKSKCSLCLWRLSKIESLEASYQGALPGHACEILTASFSHSDDFIATGSKDKTVRIWETSRCQCLHILKKHTSDVTNVQFSHDDTILATAAASQGLVCLWSTTSWEIERTIFHPDLQTMHFFPDNLSLLLHSACYTNIWCIKTGLLRHDLDEVVLSSSPIAPDGRLVTGCPKQRVIKVWDFKTSPPGCLDIKTEEQCKRAPVFSPNGDIISLSYFVAEKVHRKRKKSSVSTTNHNTYRFWNSSTGEEFPPINASHFASHSARHILFSPDNTLFVTSDGYSGSLRIWWMSTLDSVDLKCFSDENIINLKFSADKTMLIAKSSNYHFIFLKLNFLQNLNNRKEDCRKIFLKHGWSMRSSSEYWLKPLSNQPAS